ncbi:MAG: hypothetical protein HYV07_26685 [Deltaproteobacteria bacterium]|nr:hypothetical protein [Deltaproteobacteria bacterium]
MKKAFFSAALLVGAACGGRELSSPEALPITAYTAGQEIRVTFVMEQCSDSCSEYEAPTCTSDVDGETITFDISVPYKDRAGVDSETLSGCSLVCGPQVVAHCDVGPLDAGHYMVMAGSFEGEIHVE